MTVPPLSLSEASGRRDRRNVIARFSRKIGFLSKVSLEAEFQALGTALWREAPTCSPISYLTSAETAFSTFLDVLS